MSTETSSDKQSVVAEGKRAAARISADELRDDMIVGLGSGTTATLAVDAIGKRVKAGLKIIGIPTSEKTADQARGLSIPLATLGEHPKIDVTIDGADEVELGTLNLIKGGGGNHLREKIVATASARLIIAVDESKIVSRLGNHSPVPVEVAQFGWQATAQKLTRLGAKPVLRTNPDKTALVTDGGNYILDCAFGPIEAADVLARELDGVVGVIEHGLFIGLSPLVLVGGSDGVKRLS